MATSQTATFTWGGRIYSVKSDNRRNEVRLPDGTWIKVQWSKIGDDPWIVTPLHAMDPHEAVEVAATDPSITT
ncbi:MAG: hypothetical protein WC734_00840 [Patescibacteria group bacterium]|jgi:hypothetical protein